MVDKEKFVDALVHFHKKESELAVLEKIRSDDYSLAGQGVAAKQAEVTLAKKAVHDAAK